MFENDYGEKFNINEFYFGYSLMTTDRPVFDRIINPFDMNTSFNYPYEDDNKNDCCFLPIVTAHEEILLIFKTKIQPSYYDLFDTYDDYHNIYNSYINDSYPIAYTTSLINKDNQLVVMNGISIMILDINTFDVINYCYSNNINEYGINLFYIDEYYIVEDIHHKFIFFDKDLKEVEKLNLRMKNIKRKLEKKSKKKYWHNN